MSPREEFIDLINKSTASSAVKSVCISAFDAGYSLGLREGMALQQMMEKAVEDALKGGAKK